jgi:DNA modification methylase
MSDKSEIKNIEGISYLETIENESIHLVLTDPPYITSRKSGMDEQSKIVKNYEDTKTYLKTEKEWSDFKSDEYWNE